MSLCSVWKTINKVEITVVSVGFSNQPGIKSIQLSNSTAGIALLREQRGKFKIHTHKFSGVAIN